MKNIKYNSVNQNVYKQYTGSNSIVRTDLICIAIDQFEAQRLVSALNACKSILANTNDNDTGLSDTRWLAFEATQ